MRYSVTVKRPASVIPPGHQSRTSAIDPDPLGRGSYVPTVSRRTGLTLDEAERAVNDAISTRPHAGHDWSAPIPPAQFRDLAGGDTIGLPDGTVIVVEREEES